MQTKERQKHKTGLQMTIEEFCTALSKHAI